MHHIYHTEGFVLGSRNYKEAEKYYYIFTRDLGMIVASAQGVRKLSSKLRFVLQDFAYIKLDLVRGRDFWRITSASKTGIFDNLARNPETLGVLVNIFRLLKRLLTGEEANEFLFKDLLLGFSILEKSIKKEDLLNVEVIIVLRLLNNLGYLGENTKLTNFVHSPFEEDLLYEVSGKRRDLLNQINRALRETHL